MSATAASAPTALAQQLRQADPRLDRSGVLGQGGAQGGFGQVAPVHVRRQFFPPAQRGLDGIHLLMPPPAAIAKRSRGVKQLAGPYRAGLPLRRIADHGGRGLLIAADHLSGAEGVRHVSQGIQAPAGQDAGAADLGVALSEVAPLPPDPDRRTRLLGRIHAALSADDVPSAISIAEGALDAAVETPLVFNLVAYRRQVEGRLGEATRLLERAHVLAPGDVSILCALGGCMSQQGLEAQALELYERALALAPRHAPAHHGRGLALSALGRLDSSREAHLRALELAPDYPDVFGALADHAVRRGELDEAMAFARRGLALDADEPAATLAKAFVEFQCEEFQAAVATLDHRLARGALSQLHVSALEALHADALERLDQPAAALAACARSNAAMAAVHGPLMARAGVESGVVLCERVLDEFDAQARDWSAAPGDRGHPDAPRLHVFLIGFVRSGTTLLEQVLASHPDVVALEEQPILRAMAAPYFSDAAGLDRLAAFDGAQADALRADYWRRVRDAGAEPAGRVFVDKNPLDGVWLPMVAKLFPGPRSWSPAVIPVTW